MRKFAFALILVMAAIQAVHAVVTVPQPRECADKNALQGMAYDARLTAVQFYYKGIVQNIAEKPKQTCYEAHVLMDDTFAIINKTRALVETNCVPIDVAAKMAMQDVCP